VILKFVVYGEAQPAGSKRSFAVRRKENGAWVPTGKNIVVDANPKADEWKRTVTQAVGVAMQGPILDGPVALDALFFRARPRSHHNSQGFVRASAPAYPTTRPDRGKLLRSVEDALTGLVWRDDSQVVEGNVGKRYGTPARVELTVTALGEIQGTGREEKGGKG
jgi:Holliday junction resolvase RusA-like endonuclease